MSERTISSAAAKSVDQLIDCEASAGASPGGSVASCNRSSVVSAGCAPKKRPSPEQAPLRVGLATNYPPLAFEENGVVKGIEIDFAEQLSEESGTEVSILTMPWERLIPALRDGQIDIIMSGMSVTDARRKLVKAQHVRVAPALRKPACLFSRNSLTF